MAANRMILNETTYFGPGSRSVLGDEIKQRRLKKGLVVTDKDLIRFNVTRLVLDVLTQAAIPYEVFDDVKPNPTVENVKNGMTSLQSSKADFLIAVGGGSSIDTAKAMSLIAANPDFSDVKSLEGFGVAKNPPIPLIAVPTTAGTASEVTTTFIITDEEAVKKMVCGDPKVIPIMAIVDPELMATMPKGLTAATGMDALTHAIEGYLTPGAWDMTEMFVLRSIELIAQNLEKAVNDPKDMQARQGMALGQYLAGMGFANAGLGVVHSMAHTLGAFYDIPHGIANAVLLPAVMAFNAPATGEKYRAIAKAMGVSDVDGMSLDEARLEAVKAVKTLSEHISIPSGLTQLGVKEADLDKLAASAVKDVCTYGNPRPVTEVELITIYQSLL
jgi:lactaldehyde reductase